MDLNALLAKRSTAANGATAQQTSSTVPVAGFADALTSAFGNALPTDTFSALDQMVANRGARQEPIEAPRERAEAPERKSKDDVRKADRSDARDDEPKAREDNTVDREQPEDNASAADAKVAQPKSDTATVKDGDAQAAVATASNTDGQATTQVEQVAAGLPQQSATEAATDELYVATGLLASDVNADVAAEAQGTQTVDPLAAAQNAANTQQQAGQQTAQNAAATQTTQQTTAQQAGQQTAAATDAAAPAQQVEGEAEADPLAKLQAQGIAQKLDKSENISIAVSKTQQPQQTGQTQQTAQTASADKPMTATQTQMQTAVSDVDTSLDANADGNAQQNLNAANQPKQPLPGAQQGGVAAANTNGQSLFQQAMAAQGGQAAQAAQAAQAGQGAQQATTSATTATQATTAVEGTSSTSSTSAGQPTAAPLTANKGAEQTQTAQSAKAAVPKTPVPPKQVVDQVKVNIAQAAKDGADKINIRLRPTELGRVDVKLEINNDGSVRAMVIADKPETLDVLRRDSAGLDKALQDAGLKTDQDSLNFSLRDQGGQGGNSMAQNEGRSQNPYGSMAPDQDELDLMEENLAAYANTGSADGVDIRV